MSWMDEYQAALKEEKKKKKKETSSKNSSSFMDEYYEELDEIAPVAQTTTKASAAPILDENGMMNSLKNRSWFQKGAFSDGYQFGDVMKTILGTTEDLGTDLSAGVIGMGEKAVDAGAYLVGGAAGLIGQDKFKNKMQDFIKKDLYDEEKVADTAIAKALISPATALGSYILKGMGVDDEEDVSVLGDKTDSLVQSGGQLLGTMGLQAVGVPWFVTSGVTSFGGEAEGALNEGASYGEAGVSAAISAGTEILTEKLFGGSGLGEKGLINLEPLTKGISSKLVKALADYGLDVLAEGSEEVVSEIAGNLASALYKEENLGDLLLSEEAVEGYIESFIGGAALGGVMNAAKVNNSIKKGTDYRTELTENEQKVFDKVYQEAIAEESKNGKVTKKRQAEIHDNILEQMDKGYISTDKIEEILGGDTYKSYSDTVKSEDSLVEQEKTLTEEFNKLNRKPWRDMTGEEHDRLAELKEQLPKLREQIEVNKKGETRNQLKSQLSGEVSKLLQSDRQGSGSRLMESYNEKFRMTQDFEADFEQYKGSKYADAAKKTLESAIKAGANNSNRVHDLVDMAAKTSADTGLTFEFKSGEQIKADFIARQKAEIEKLEGMKRTAEQNELLAKLKDTLAKVESGEMTVNGDISGDSIVLNLDSKKPLNRVAGHEITHSFEPAKGQKSAEYQELKDSLFAYAKTKGMDIEAELAKRNSLYAGLEADAEAELVADLVGDYLFTDDAYIKQLSTENQNLFQKLWSEVKHLYKMATAGSQEARELARVQKAFEDAYRNGAHKTTGTKHSISETTDGRFVAVVDNDILSKIDTSKLDKETKKKVKKAASEELKKFADGFTINGIEFIGNSDTRREYTRTDYSEALARKNPTAYLDKMRATDVLDDVIQVATNWKNDNKIKHDRDDYVDFVRGKTLIMSGDRAYSAVVLAGITSDGRAIFHDVEDVYPDSFELKKSESSTAVSANESPNYNLEDSDAPTVAQKGEDVKHKLSLSDSDGKQLTKEQSEFFKDSKIVDADGNLKVMHHGSPESFTVFDKKKAKASGYYGKGFYFTDSDSHAKQYGNTYDVYLNITNPLQDGTKDITKDQLRKFVEAIAENEDYGIDNYGYDATVDSVTDSVYGKSDFAMLMDINASCVGNMVEAIELFNEVNGTDYNGIVAPTETVAFYPEQIKNIDNLKPTSDPDIRYSLSERSYAEIQEEQQNLYRRERDLTERKRTAENDPELLQAMDDYSNLFSEMRGLLAKRHQGTATQEELDRIEEIKALREEKMQRVADIQESLGLKALSEEAEEIRKTKEELRKASDAAWAREGAEKENKAIEKSGLSAPEYFRKKALKAFKTTTNFNEAGYMLPDGKLLNFSGGERNHRYRDHREIGEIYEATNGTAALNRFLNDGNIRIMAESPGIDLAAGVEPTREQYAALRKFINTNGTIEGQFFVDFSGTEGNRVGNYSYEGRVNADRVLNDIKYFYQNGEVREQSSIGQFLSLSANDEEIAPGKFDVYGSDFRVVEGDDVAPVAENTQTENAEVAVNDEEDFAPVADSIDDAVSPMQETGTEAIRPKREPSNEPRMVRADSNGKRRKWVGTSTESDAVDGKVLPEDLDQDLIHYQPISNKKTLGNANARLDRMGYEASVTYLNSQFENNKVTLDDIALGERLIQEAVKKGDTKTAGDLIMDISILGTELGQKVQALSIIKRLTPEGQLRMLQRTVERGKAKGDKAFEGVEITQDMIDHILKTYGKDGTYDQAELNQAVEDVKQKIADQMDVTARDKVNAWRYLSMLGNPKTHIRNLVSNVAMKGTVAVKNAVARTIEGIAPVKNRTKTWKTASEDVKSFARQTTLEMKDIISGDSKYSESASIKEKRQIFKNKILNGVYEFNSDMLGKEDWWFSKSAFTNSLSEFLTANGIETEADIQNNPKLIEKAKQYALEQAQIATFRQYSWLASKINDIERKNVATEIAVGSVLPFKKTPINIAKTGLNYSPLGFAKTLTYDAVQVKKGNMEASELIDHLSQNVTGSALTLVGYMLASAGFLNGAGDDDKEGDYDYQLGKQAYSVNIGGATYSLSWLSPVAMPLFVGANAYEQLVEGKEWNGDVVVETLAQTLDPLSEMSFISSLDSVLSSYDSGLEKFAGIFETAAQNYVTQFAPTLMSQVATVTDDTKRSTKASADSGFKFFDETINKLMYKIPVLRNLLEPSTDIWGNEIKQSENVLERAFESFLAPYARREDIATSMDDEIKDLYKETGDGGVIPSVPYNYINYDGVKYEMSASDFTDFKKMYGQTAAEWMERLFETDTYQNADSETRADMVNRVYDYARDEAKLEYFARHGVDFTNATEDKEEVYRENPIKGAIENDMTVDEYSFSVKNPEKYAFFKENGISYSQYASADEDGKRAYTWAYENPGKYETSKAIADDFLTYWQYKSELGKLESDKDENGESISGSKKEKVIDYINNMDLDYGQKIILFRSMYESKEDKNTYNSDIVDYLNGREDISYDEMVTILKELGFTVDSNGNVSW